MPASRSYDRAPADIRPVTIEPGFVATADGSALISVGRTRVICTASVNEHGAALDAGPRQGLGHRRVRDAARLDRRPQGSATSRKGKQDGRGVEIQRLIGRSLRVVVDFKALGERSVYVDCDVLQADGGTRCAAITGGYVALRLALQKLVDAKAIETMPLTGSVAAVSVGMVDGRALCDLDYAEDSQRRGRRQRRDDRRRRPGRGAGDGGADAALAGLARRAAGPRRGRHRAPAGGAGAGRARR